MAKRYCVMCLADDEREEAVFTTEINGEVAGYCLACAMTMRKNGFAMDRIDLRKRDGRKYTILTDAQRVEIAESRDTVDKIAARYGVSDTTIRSIRNKARAKYLTEDAVKAESSVKACEGELELSEPEEVESAASPHPATGNSEPKTFAPPAGWYAMGSTPVADQLITQPVTVPITLELTHETANAIWGGLTLDEKATFCRTKIIERLMEMA